MDSLKVPTAFISELSAGLYLAALIIIGLVVWRLITRGNLLTVTLLSILFALLIHNGLQQIPEMVGEQAPVAIVVTATAIPASIVISDDGAASSEMTMVQAKWSRMPSAVARWQANILQALLHCDVGQVTGNYDATLLMAAIVMQESSGDPNAIGKAYDTGLAQVVPNEHPSPMFDNRPSQAQLLDPQFNLNYAACLLRDNIKRTGSVRAGLTAYNGSATYPDVILAHYTRFAQASLPATGGIQTIESQNYRFTANPFGAFNITSHFRSNERPNHKGLDLVASGDDTIRAVESGIVEWIGPFYCASACLGPLAIVINHGSWRTVYGHADLVYVNIGDVVLAGQSLARQGTLGNSTGPHLHLEVRLGGRLWVNEHGVAFILDSQLVNPVHYLN